MNRRSEIIHTASFILAIIFIAVCFVCSWLGNLQAATFHMQCACMMLLCSIIVKMEWL